MPDTSARPNNLQDLLAGIKYRVKLSVERVVISAIVTDSRKVKEGALFVAIAGHHVDGHDYISQAIEKGCAAVVVEEGRGLPDSSVPFVEVADSRAVLAEIAAIYAGKPAEKLTLIGITGTNGKTTTSYLLESIIRQAGYSPGVIGTVNYRFNNQEFPAPFTTPEPLILHETLRQMVSNGVTHVVMEVSSHSLVEQRIYGLMFDVALFTNLSRDHLDFHSDMEDYFLAKKLLFSKYLKRDGSALVVCENRPAGSLDSRDYGRRLLADIRQEGKIANILSCGFQADNDLMIKRFTYGLTGSRAEIVYGGKQTVQVSTDLVGEFNLCNVLGAVAVCLALGMGVENIEKGVAKTKTVPGRLEKIEDSAERLVGFDDRKGRPAIFVDYAHTPDALENVLKTLRTLTTKKLIVVFGCGGDRDRGKRSLMGEVAGRAADLIIVTADNSRSEATSAIMNDIEVGLQTIGRKKVDKTMLAEIAGIGGYLLINSRSEAIRSAITFAGDGDVVLIAGKGHENYQIENGKTIFFDDRVEAKKYLEARSLLAVKQSTGASCSLG